MTNLSKIYIILKENNPLNILNKGYSVLEIVNTFEKVNNLKINYRIAPRRSGDIAACYADPSKAKEEINWQAEKGIEEMCRDAWNFAKRRLQ